MDRRAELEAALDADPYDLASYEVLGDYLSQLGDPRGELIALQIASGRDPAIAERAEVVRKRAGLSPKVSQKSRVEWRAGYIHRATLVRADVAAADHVAGRFLAELVLLDFTSSRDDGGARAAFDQLARQRRPALRRLQLTSSDSRPHHRIGEIGSLLRSMPALTHLQVVGQVTVDGGFDLPSLVELDLSFGSLETSVLAGIREASWPALVSLAIRGPGHVGNWDEIRPIFANPPPRLARLSLTNNVITYNTLDALSRSPLLQQLTHLRLSNSIDDKDIERLGAFDTFRHLELLDLAGNRLTAKGIARAKGLAREVLCAAPASGS